MPETSTKPNYSVYLRLIGYLKPYTRHIILVLIFNFLYVILNALSAWMVAPVIETIFKSKPNVETRVEAPPTALESNEIVPENADSAEKSASMFNVNHFLKQQMKKWLYRDEPLEMLKLLCIFVVITFTLKNLFAFAEFFWMSYVEQSVIKTLREAVYEHVVHQSMQFFNRHQTGNLISRITNDINAVNVAINRSFTKIIRDPVLIALYILILFNISWQLTMMALIVFPLSIALIQKIGSSLKRKSHRVQEDIASLTTILQETISGIKVVKAFGMEDRENNKFRGEVFRHFRSTLRQVRLHRLSSPLSETLGVSVMAFVLWYGGNMVLSGHLLSSEDFMRFIIFLFMMMDPIKSLGDLNNNIQIAMASGQRIFHLLDTPITTANKPDAKTLPYFSQKIEYKNVAFRYDDDGPEILKKINLEIHKNQKVAFVGSSGAGKTTLVNLLPRFYDIRNGSISIDGLDIRDVSLKSLRQQMGIVTQEVILFNDTVANNIAYGAEKYNEANILHAAKLANAEQFIKELPNGFDTIIGERGVLLSGGQQQRVSIARAILKNPPILIFDEATSSLDSESEFLIQEAIENLMKDRTVLMIAHRLSSIINSDKIVLLERGEILDIGSHEELLSRSERYQRLCEFQFKTSG